MPTPLGSLLPQLLAELNRRQLEGSEEDRARPKELQVLEQRRKAEAKAWWERYGRLLERYCLEGEACPSCWCGISVQQPKEDACQGPRALLYSCRGARWFRWRLLTLGPLVLACGCRARTCTAMQCWGPAPPLTRPSSPARLPCLPAAAAPCDRAQRLACYLLEEQRDFQPAFVLAAALAAGQLRQEVEVDGLRQLRLSDSSLTLWILEAKRSDAGAGPCSTLRLASGTC
jgi:hypothetical protein